MSVDATVGWCAPTSDFSSAAENTREGEASRIRFHSRLSLSLSTRRRSWIERSWVDSGDMVVVERKLQAPTLPSRPTFSDIC